MKKVLIVSDTPTHPTRAGDQWGIVAKTEILKQLGCEVHLLYIKECSMWASKADYSYISPELKEYWGENLHIKVVPRIEKVWFNLVEKYRKFFCGMFVKYDDKYPHGLHKVINHLDNKYHFDICIACYYYLSKSLSHIRIPKRALHTIDCFTYKKLVVGEPCYSLTPNEEAKVMQMSPYIFAVQDEEEIYFRKLSPASKVYNIYSVYDFHELPLSNNHNIVFLSGSNGYNQNGIKWFISEIFPSILRLFPDAQLVIGGAICDVIDITGITNVKLLGKVNSPEELYKMGDVAINPTYQGTGLKIKTFEAISYGKVVLTHPHSTIGVFKKETAPIFSSTNPKEWTAELVKFWNHPDLIIQRKEKDKDYINDLKLFVTHQYQNFLED